MISHEGGYGRFVGDHDGAVNHIRGEVESESFPDGGVVAELRGLFAEVVTLPV